MNFLERVMEGVWAVNIGLKTPLTGNYRILLLYPIIAQLLSIGAVTLILAMQGHCDLKVVGDMFRLGIQHISNQFEIKKIALVLSTFLDFLMMIALVFHFIHIWYSHWSPKKVTLLMSIRFAASKIGIILTYTLITTALRLAWPLISFAHADPSRTLWYAITTLVVVWSLFLIILLPLIALEEEPTLSSTFWLTVNLFRTLTPQVLGGLLWFLIVTVGVNIIINTLPFFIESHYRVISYALVTIGSGVTAHLTVCHAIFGTLMYLGFKDEIALP